MNIIVEFKTDDGKAIGVGLSSSKGVVRIRRSRGSRGFYANGKLEIDSKRYQVQVQLVEIGSKPSAEKE